MCVFDTMEICEIFYSIQGEGVWMGYPTVFVRVSGCNLRCRYCDTTYAYGPGEVMSIDDVMERVDGFGVRYVCVTGGEPLLQEDTVLLVDRLLKRGYKVSLETNGSIDIKSLVERFKDFSTFTVSCDIKCPSSGMHDKMRLENVGYLREVDQLKFVVKDKEDYRYAKKVVEKGKPSCVVLFQPVWGEDPKQLAAWLLKDKLDARLSLQIHKVLWGEKRGV